MTTIITTRSGTEYTITRTLTQDVVVRWDDAKYDGHPGMQGGRVKVVEHCLFQGLPKVGEGLSFEGQDRYSGRPFRWQTSTIMSIVRNGTSLQELTAKKS